MAEWCNWCNKRITLHLDHINGISNDNRKENLRFLCPNCHQQTDTWGNKKAAVEKSGDSLLLESSVATHTSSNLVSGITKIKKYCIDCGKEIHHKSTRCRPCKIKLPFPTKIVWPSKEELLKQLETKSYLALSKELGVSDNAIRKHLKRI